MTDTDREDRAADLFGYLGTSLHETILDAGDYGFEDGRDLATALFLDACVIEYDYAHVIYSLDAVAVLIEAVRNLCGGALAFTHIYEVEGAIEALRTVVEDIER